MKKKYKAAALPTVIVVMIVVTILVTIIINIALADTRFAMIQQHQTQTHFIAQSGVYVGLGIINDELTNYNNKTTAEIVSLLKTKISELKVSSPNDFVLDGIGEYEIDYELVDATSIKIVSRATSYESSSLNDVQTLRVTLMLPSNPTKNPTEWISGINLFANIKANDFKYLGSSVLLEGKNKPIQSPQSPTATPVYSASLIYFSDYEGVSLYQINNSADITFDASILYFASDVKMNSSSDDYIILTYSDEVSITKSIINGVDPLMSGYESETYYDALVATLNEIPAPESQFDKYKEHFESGVKYGVVYFGGNITKANSNKNNPDEVIFEKSSGVKYYFYPSGINLKTVGDTDRLIQLEENDPLIRVIEKYLNLTIDQSSLLWGRE